MHKNVITAIKKQACFEIELIFIIKISFL